MAHQLTALTEPGRELVALAEGHAADFATRAASHDREGTFPFENLAELKASRYLYAPIPTEYGGLGVESVHDVFVASSRLAQGDPSVTVGVNMHLISMLSMARAYRIACHREQGARASALGARMEAVVRDGAVIGAAVSEPEQDLLRPKTRIRREGDGWLLSGRKIISSLAPAATHFFVSAIYANEESGDRHVQLIVPRDTPGVTVHDDWDALGVRASGSVTVSFEDAPLAELPRRSFPAGIITPEYLEFSMPWGPGQAAISLGVAEAAQEQVVAAIARRRERPGADAPRGTVLQLAAENAIDLAAARAILDRALLLIDEYDAAHADGERPSAEAHALYAEVQAAKTFVNQAAVRIADRSMTMVGGGAYMNAHPLSRFYRDARAGAFMQPLGANLAYEYIGAVALGAEPERF